MIRSRVAPPVPRYRFANFILSPRQRRLVCDGREQPLIPRYFDLLVFLVEHRHEAVHRRDIFDRVWSDVIVSDSALSQAIRTIRRALGDDSREPRFIRTVSRHGYRFVFEVIEEEDDQPTPPETAAAEPAVTASPPPAPAVEAAAPAVDAFEPLLQRVTRIPQDAIDEEDQREAAELLHTLGIDETLRRLGTRPRHAHARALLRDVRWDAADAGHVPLRTAPAFLPTVLALIRLRLHRAARAAAGRWAGASVGGALAGLTAGVVGGSALVAAPESAATMAVVPALAFIGSACGAVGGAGVGAGLSVAEAIARSRRAMVLLCGGAAGGALAGLAAEWLGRWSLAALVDLHLELGGGLEGLVIGGGAGLGYALATAQTQGGLAAPRGRERLRVAAITALACGLAALALTLTGRPLAGGTVHLIAQAAHGSQALLTPLARLIGEPDFGPLTGALIGTGEGAVFGFGLALGLTRRPQNP